MKYNKETLQKIFLAAILVVGAIYCYFAMLLGPLSAREIAATKEIAALEPKISAAKSQILSTHSLEISDTSAASAREIFDIMKATIPEGASIAWFPQRISDFFKWQGLGKISAHLNSESANLDLAGYKDSLWSIEIPKVEYAPLGIAIAGLENQEGLLQITNLQIDASLPDVQFQRAQLTFSTLVKQ